MARVASTPRPARRDGRGSGGVQRPPAWRRRGGGGAGRSARSGVARRRPPASPRAPWRLRHGASGTLGCGPGPPAEAGGSRARREAPRSCPACVVGRSPCTAPGRSSAARREDGSTHARPRPSRSGRPAFAARRARREPPAAGRGRRSRRTGRGSCAPRARPPRAALRAIPIRRSGRPLPGEPPRPRAGARSPARRPAPRPAPRCSARSESIPPATPE